MKKKHGEKGRKKEGKKEKRGYNGGRSRWRRKKENKEKWEGHVRYEGVKREGSTKKRKKREVGGRVCNREVEEGRGGRNERRADVRRWLSGRVKSRQEGRERREKGKVKRRKGEREEKEKREKGE